MKDKNHGVVVAPGAGFCPGVKKAIDCVLHLEAAGKKPIYTIGPLIHNKQVTDMLAEKGITSIDELSQAKDKNGVLVIRAHGITPEFGGGAVSGYGSGGFHLPFGKESA